MTWIKNTNPERHPTRTLRNDLTNGERVTFTENWKANVSSEVAEALCGEHDHYVPVENRDDESNTDESDTDTDSETEED